MAQQPIKVKFLHPRDSRPFEVEVGPQTTGAKAIDGLVRHGFLDADARDRYVLQRQANGKQVALDRPLVASGVKDGEAIVIVQSQEGAA